MVKRALRSSTVLLREAALEPAVALEVSPSTPKKRKINGSLKKGNPQSPKKPKYTFKQWENDLAIRYPIPEVLTLPSDYVSKHNTSFIKGIQHILEIDPSLYPWIVSAPFDAFSKDGSQDNCLADHHSRLCRSVIGQQVSGAAALSIENKFKALHGGVMGTPQQILDTEDERLRGAGLSTRKTEYIKSISKKFVDGDVDLKLFTNGSDEEVIEKLVEMKGIGTWSAKMFMCFGLQRLNIFAYDDLGVARGMSRYLDTRPELLAVAKKEVDMSLHTKRSTFDDKRKRDWKVIHDAHVNHVADSFAPYRSIFMLILWRISSTNIEILEHKG